MGTGKIGIDSSSGLNSRAWGEFNSETEGDKKGFYFLVRRSQRLDYKTNERDVIGRVGGRNRIPDTPKVFFFFFFFFFGGGIRIRKGAN